jgi:hypothetical protein
MTMLRRLALVASSSALLLLAACGGSGSSSGASGLSLADFIAKANMVCTNANASGAAVPAPSVASLGSPSATELSALGTYLSSLLTVGQAYLTNLQNLGSPPSNQAAWTQALSAVQGEVGDIQAAQSAAQGGDTAGYSAAFTKVSADGASAHAAFSTFGATTCAGGSSASSAPAPTPT